MPPARRANGVRVSPALVVASLALAVSLGGTGYAAFKLPANSVGPVNLKKNAVTSLKVKNGALQLIDFAPAERLKLKGDTGDAGLKGDAGAKGDRGDKGDKGEPGPVGMSALQRVSGPPYSIASGGSATLTHTCPAGKRVLAGGTLSNSSQGIVSSSWPSAEGTWSVGVRNPYPATITFQVWAVCAVVG